MPSPALTNSLNLKIAGIKKVVAELKLKDKDEELYKQVLKQVLLEPRKQLWLVEGESGLGKTALLENWVKDALELKKTPIFIYLGSDLSPQEEAAVSMSQHGDIDVKPEVAFDMLKAGGFVILLDAFNEDITPNITREFVQKVSIRNHVIMTSQFSPPGWKRYLTISRINLEPFGYEQLEKIMPKKWAKKLLNSEYLKDLAELPQTAELLALYVKQYNNIPALRLDIFRNLQNNLENKYSSELLNLERISWELFKIHEEPFKIDNAVPKEFCEAALEQGIITKKITKENEKLVERFQFRHELIHRFFVTSYLWRQDRQSLEDWYNQVPKKLGLGREYWSKTLEFWGEMFAEKATADNTFMKAYYQLLEEVANFSTKIYADRLFPQLERLYRLGLLKKDEEFILWSAKKLAKAAARIDDSSD